MFRHKKRFFLIAKKETKGQENTRTLLEKQIPTIYILQKLMGAKNCKGQSGDFRRMWRGRNGQFTIFFWKEKIYKSGKELKHKKLMLLMKKLTLVVWFGCRRKGPHTHTHHKTPQPMRASSPWKRSTTSTNKAQSLQIQLTHSPS